MEYDGRPEGRAGFVLVGGKSARMGRDKALLPYGGATLAEHIAAQVKAASGSATLVGNPELYRALPYPLIPDVHPGSGPLGGVEAALRSSTARWNLIVACDMPSLTVEFLASLLANAETCGGECLVPVSPAGRPEPLCAVWDRGCLDTVARALGRGVRKMAEALEGVRAVYQPIGEQAWFENLNTPEDLARHRESENRMNEAHPHYIEFRHVDKTFDTPVLVDVSFEVNAGETVAIIGRSGVGKSVTLAHIMGFLKPDRGQVIVAHEDITDYPESELARIRRKVTMVFQSGALFDSLTIAENILFSLELREDYDEQNKEDVVNGLLKMVDLAEYVDAYPSDISTGYKRAVAIARALAAQPECVLYDEPTTMVDPIMSDHIASLMLRLKEHLKLTSIVVTHDIDLMRRVADRVVFLHEGHVIFSGPVPDLERSENPNIQEFLALDRV